MAKVSRKKSSIPSITAVEFSNRFARSISEQGQRFTWFLGAGCSISSGISAADALVERWMRELTEIQQLPDSGIADWRKKSFPNYDSKKPALSYAEIFKRRHPAPIDRQREIEMICAQAEPAYGYATFAQLLSSEGIGRLCNIILTTNFDDLILEALYMYGERAARPQVISHESLTRYVRINSPRPTIVKLHGDAHLDPKNLTPETEKITEDAAEHLYPFVQDSALIFIGYGGNDKSIVNFFVGCPEAALASQIYWVSKEEPPDNFIEWLSNRRALRVDHTDFDRLMHQLRGALMITHPKRERWNENYDNYLKQYSDFEREIEAQPTSEEKSALLQVSVETNKSLPADVQVLVAADMEPKRARQIHEDGLRMFPDSGLIHNSYGVFLLFANEPDRAEVEFRRAVELTPDNANYLYNLGAALLRWGDSEEAGKLLKQALDLSPLDPRKMAQYALFLDRVRNDAEGALDYFKRAVALNSNDESFETNYGQFLLLRGQTEEGLRWLKRALTPWTAKHLAVRILFNQYVSDQQRSGRALKSLYQKLRAGDREYFWDIAPVIERAVAEGLPNAEFIRALGRVAGNEMVLSTLDSYPPWLKLKKKKKEKVRRR
jgi:Tfp pilus assembly protein PilF